MNSPFKLLDAYDRDDREFFFGREVEIENLYNMVFNAPAILIYGLSGTGKTSLVKCGLASRFDGPDWYPIYIRRWGDLNRSLFRTLKSKCKNTESVSLTTLLEELQYRHMRPIYLIFDQFEELYTLGTEEEARTFEESIIEIANKGLSCRLLFVMREEFIGRLYSLERALPGLQEQRLRVEPMGLNNVENVISGSFSKFNIKVEPPESDRFREMVDLLSTGQSNLQLPYLQVYLDMIYRKTYEETYGKKELEPWPSLHVSAKQIKSLGNIDKVLDRFLDIQTEAVQNLLLVKYSCHDSTAFRILDAFASSDGMKIPLPYQTDEKRHISIEGANILFPEMSDKVIDTAVRAFEASRLLRVDRDHIELAHDSLAKLIDSRRSESQRRMKDVLRRINNSYQEYLKTNKEEFLSRNQINSFIDILPVLPLTPELKDFVRKSRDHIEAADRKHLNQRRAVMGTILSIAVIAIIIAIWALNSRFKLGQQTYINDKRNAESLLQARLFSEAKLNLDFASINARGDQRDSLRALRNKVNSLEILLTRADTISEFLDSVGLERRVDMLIDQLDNYYHANRIAPGDILIRRDKENAAGHIRSSFESFHSSAMGLFNYKEYDEAIDYFQLANRIINIDTELLSEVFPVKTANDLSSIKDNIASHIIRCESLIK